METAQDSVTDLAKRWLDQDRDPITREQIQQLLSSNKNTELARRLRPRIAFGTAGLRASMQAGYAYMNSLTVLQASHGLARYIIDQRGKSQQQLKVVIGYDARHNSERFARLAAAAFIHYGFQVIWFGKLVHTPMVPFAVRHYSADAGVMVTASHNPKNDNGYKVYWQNGCQIIPPHDAGIAASIDRVAEEAIDTWGTAKVDSNNTVISASSLTYTYLESVLALLDPPSGQARPKWMYTPMHGVGLPFMKQVAAGIPGCSEAMRIVEAQADPDPDFPTVPFPNPEEKGALDLAKKRATEDGCSLIIVNDPDADRFAAAEQLDDGQWHQFSGNQMGVLLASYVLETHQGDRAKLAMLASTVSSRMLAAMSTEEGFYFQETLTGFKWLGNVAQDLRAAGYDPAFAYEEAIGYMFPSVVWDKDGIAAAAVFLTACSLWKEQGLTPWTKLQQLYQRYGYFEDANTYLTSPSPDVTNKVFGDIRTLEFGARPVRLGTRRIQRWRDLTLGYDSGTPDSKPLLPVDASAQMITCELSGGAVFTARGSGTEPKIKLYIEARADNVATAKLEAEEVLRDLLLEWFRPEVYGLNLAGT